MPWLADSADVAVNLQGVVVVSGAGYALKALARPTKPPFCKWCGVSNHAPLGERVRPRPRNPHGAVGQPYAIGGPTDDVRPR